MVDLWVFNMSMPSQLPKPLRDSSVEAALKRRRWWLREGCSGSHGRRRNVAIDMGMTGNFRICNANTPPHTIAMTYQRASLRHEISEGVYLSCNLQSNFFGDLSIFNLPVRSRMRRCEWPNPLFYHQQNRALFLGCHETTGRPCQMILPLKGDGPSQGRGGGPRNTRTPSSQYLDLR